MSCDILPDFDLVCVKMDSSFLFEPLHSMPPNTASTTDTVSSLGQHRPLHEEAANPYNILQVRRDATPSEIRESYKRLALWHHPGRVIHNCDEERNRRAQVFEILAASYETLMDNDVRARYDNLREHRTLTMGQVHVGGRLLTTVKSGGTEKQATDAWNDCFTPKPPPSPKKRRYRNPREDCDYFEDVHAAIPALATASSSSSQERVHWFNGPLATMYQARNFMPFTDPIDVFEEVFGSRIFHEPATKDSLSDSTARLPLRSPTRSSAWTGSTTTKRDGTIVSTTTRVLFDRKMTRTEITTFDPITKRRHTRVTVTSEELEPPLSQELIAAAVPGACECVSCGNHNNMDVVEDEIRQDLQTCASSSSADSSSCEKQNDESSAREVYSFDYWTVCGVSPCCATLFPV